MPHNLSLPARGGRSARDPERFASLRSDVLPNSISHAPQHGNEMRVWLAGCATGEEAYSLAILFSEVLGSNLGQFIIRLPLAPAEKDASAEDVC